ncbi:unnamed protein product [Hymenolepis diminuta]|uniref:Rho family GTPase n=1 Tax=Hymenolepis diminuta TaxID=6216 RepID=A0A0R3SHR5_HYMDI|nr:unnamed protein product [Hymenolepis diminuta]VUZ39799.1 unnamed protein product [Hymenolepis diminuta]
MNERSIKCVVVGDGMVGKTCLVLRYMMGDNGEFEKYIPTIADEYTAKVTVKNTQVIFNLWDTAGQEEFKNLRKASYPVTDVFLVCFAVDNKDAFRNVEDMWIPEVTQYCPNAAVILVGTKADTRIKMSNLNSVLTDQTVSYAMGKKMAKKWKLYDYVECSAKTGEGVKSVFDMAIKAGLNPRKFKKGHGCLVM